MSGRDRLRDARVMVVGCGALGNEVLKNLALCGVGHIFCVDSDRVEAGNLSRSVLFRPADAESGRSKVDVVRERLLELDSSIDIHTIEGDIAYDVGLGLIRSMDVVVSCVDSRWARFMINRHCIRMNIPWVDGGISVSEGTARVFFPKDNCYACSLDPEALAQLKRRVSCSNTIAVAQKAVSAPTTSITASIVGAVQAQEAMRIICGDCCADGKMFFYDGDVPKAGIAEFRSYDDDCPEHEVWQPVGKSDFAVNMAVSDFLDAVGREKGEELSIILRDDVFVDYIESRTDGRHYRIMRPGRCVSGNIPEGMSPDDFYQSEFRTIDRNFPYAGLTLAELGVPKGDVLHLRGLEQDFYIELV